jgi:NAD(P)-dependent dehydrogenase (short-subunit alcohol dehydrogenase family)
VEHYHRVCDINIRGVLLSMKHEISAILRSGGGAIVNNSSVGGHIGFPGASVYVASKFAVIGLTKTAALEFAKQGVRVNSVSPGPIQTEMFDRSFDEGETDVKKTIATQTRLAASARRRKSPAWCSGSVHRVRRSPRARTSLWMADTPHNSRKINVQPESPRRSPLMQFHAPRRLMLMRRSKTSSSISAVGVALQFIPALLKAASSRPKV